MGVALGPGGASSRQPVVGMGWRAVGVAAAERLYRLLLLHLLLLLRRRPHGSPGSGPLRGDPSWRKCGATSSSSMYSTSPTSATPPGTQRCRTRRRSSAARPAPAGKVFRKFPWSLICLGVPVADCKLRAGKATIHGDGVSQRFVVNLFGQLDKGWGNKQGKRRAAWAAGLRNDHGADDSKSRRLQFFTQALADFEAQALAAAPPAHVCCLPRAHWLRGRGRQLGRVPQSPVIEGFQLRNPRVRVVLVRWG